MSDIRKQLNRLRGDESESSAGTSSIRERLDRLYRRSNQQKKHFPEEQVVRAQKRLEELVPGEYVNTHHGDIYRSRHRYDLDDRHGNCRIKEFLQLDSISLARLGRVEDAELELRNALFLDTEASGLSGGTGTYAFMIGLGYFHEKGFVVDQLFVENYAKEEGMLDLLRSYLEGASLLISFNGKSFDVNLLQTRFLMHGQEPPFTALPHLDLLHPCRNLWDLTLANCRLQTLERDVLQFTREHDTPGEEVPGIYFEYLRTGDPTEITGVFQHNLLDIVSLLSLTIMLEQNFQGVRSIPDEDGLTNFSRGRMHERQGNAEAALHYYSLALEENLSSTRRYKALGCMAGIHKRNGSWEEAISLWEDQIESSPTYVLEPYVELAKYYEHQQRAYKRAIGYVKRALESLPSHKQDERDLLEYRMDRLIRKLQGDR